MTRCSWLSSPRSGTRSPAAGPVKAIAIKIPPQPQEDVVFVN